MPAGEDGRRAPPFAVLEALLQFGEIELGDARTQRCDLAPELLGAFRRGRLQGERAQPFLHLRLDVAGALDLNRDARELQLGAMLALLEASQARRLLEQLTTLFGLRAEDLLDAALSDDRVHPAAESQVGQQLDQVDAPHRGAVQQVLALAAAMQPPRDGELGVRERALPVRVVEQELDLAEILPGPSAAAGEDHVVGLLGAQLRRRHGAGRPDDRVRDVGLPRPVRPHDHGDARLQPHLHGLRERLEAAQPDCT